MNKGVFARMEIMGIPVLMYHEIGGSSDRSHPYAVSEKDFEDQLKYIQTNQYQTVLLENHIEADKNDRPSRDKKVILTFDDTQISNYTKAYPLLRKFSYVANFFISTDFINKKRIHLNKSQILELAQNGMSIQSHTHTHAFLNGLDIKSIYSELKRSKEILEEIVKKEVTLLSWPGGRFNITVFKVAKDVGYKGICISIPGIKSTVHETYVFGRFLISSNTDLQAFENILRMRKTYVFRKQLEYFIKDALKKLLGNNLYHNFWKIARRNRVKHRADSSQ